MRDFDWVEVCCGCGACRAASLNDRRRRLPAEETGQISARRRQTGGMAVLPNSRRFFRFFGGRQKGYTIKQINFLLECEEKSLTESCSGNKII